MSVGGRANKIYGIALILTIVAGFSFANVIMNYTVVKTYFAGLIVDAVSVINLTGMPEEAPLSAAGPKVGSPLRPFVGIASKIVSNNGNNAVGGSPSDHITRYRAAGLFGNEAYAGAPDTYGVDIQMGADHTAPPNMSFIGLELDMASGKERDCTSLGGPFYCLGLLVTGSSAARGALLSEAYSVEGRPDTFHRGYATVAGVRDVGFLDASQSEVGFELEGGSHKKGFHVGPGAASEAAFSSPGFKIDPKGNAFAQSYIQPLHTPKSSVEACEPGQFVDDEIYHYVCISRNHWKRVMLSPF